MSAETRPTPRAIRLGAILFAGAVFLISWWHWWSFQYGTFDLAFYVQALWLALRGQWHVSLLDVPLMGNHAEPLVFLLVPFFAICPHPMLLVAVQTLALASMAFTGFRIATRLGLENRAAICMGLATLLTPATSSVGLHEFHPETFAAPLLLLLIEARLAQRLGWFALWFAAVLACKENMALLLVAWCVVFTVLDRQRGRAWQVRWNLVPMLIAGAWLLLYAMWISPTLNAGKVDYLELYSHLGSTGREIVTGFFTDPARALSAISQALMRGNMVWALQVPLLALPLLRPRWLLIAAPILLQHLLSWRPAEWSLGAHYAAPFIPLVWIAAVEALSRFQSASAIAAGTLAACLLAHARFGPARELGAEVPALGALLEQRQWKAQMLAQIPPQASVMASQSLLSHLAMRERVHSLHHLLKGLKTLSRAAYTPPAIADVVVIDYTDASTFNVEAGYYHPRNRSRDGRITPSSDRLLHEYLRQERWTVLTRNELAIFTRGEPTEPFPPDTPAVPFDQQTTLLNMQLPEQRPGALRFRFAWEFSADRQRFPWLMLVLSDGRHLHPFIKGACAPEAGPGTSYEEWTVVFPSSLPAGDYELFALFYDASEAAWRKRMPPDAPDFVMKRIDLGHRQIKPGAFDAREAGASPR